MPTGYTYPVKDGEITELKDFAALCARAFGAFIHLRDESMSHVLTYPAKDDFYARQLASADAELAEWLAMTEEQKYAKWSEYAEEQEKYAAESRAKRAVAAERYYAMLAQVESVVVPEELDKFKEFMVEQLTDSIKFDVGDGTFERSYHKVVPFYEWMDDHGKRLAHMVERYIEEAKKEAERYEERIRYIDLMAETFGFEVEGK